MITEGKVLVLGVGVAYSYLAAKGIYVKNWPQAIIYFGYALSQAGLWMITT